MNKLYIIIAMCLALSIPANGYAQHLITPIDLEDSIKTSKYHGSYLVVAKDYNSLVHFYHGLKDGQWVTFDYNFSRDVKIETYKRGKKEGLWSLMTQHGGFSGMYKNDRKEGLWSEGYEESNIGHYKKGLKEGKWRYSKPESEIDIITEYKKGRKNGAWDYKSGDITIKGEHKNNMKNGLWEYYLNNNLYQKKIYKNDSLLTTKNCLNETTIEKEKK